MPSTGIEKPPSKEMLAHNAIWAIATIAVKVSQKTSPKPSIGIKKPLSKAMPKRN